jgi:arsenate reductase
MHTASAGFLVLIGAILASAGVCQSAAPPQRQPTAPVVFVCEHGNVKSLIAASLFEQVAKKRGLPFRAVSRGLSPESSVPPKIADALRSDGVEIASFKPQPLTPRDVSTASQVIAIGVDISSFVHEDQVSTELWSDVPPASIDYAASRAVLLRHIDVLLDKLQTKP